MRRHLPPTGIALLLVCILMGAPAAAREPQPLRVFAAASLVDLWDALAAGFADAPLAANFGASSVLARQIHDGAPADVFLSASADWMTYLEEADVLAGAALAFAGNQLVCVATRGSSLSAEPPADAAALLARIGPSGRVAIADEGVPAGEYARSALRHAGLLDAARSRLVGQKDVRAVLLAVERGELDAGFVYATEANAGDVVVLFSLDPRSHPPIEYLGAVIRDTSNVEMARSFLDYLHGEAARAILARSGFAVR